MSKWEEVGKAAMDFADTFLGDPRVEGHIMCVEATTLGLAKENTPEASLNDYCLLVRTTSKTLVESLLPKIFRDYPVVLEEVDGPQYIALSKILSREVM